MRAAHVLAVLLSVGCLPAQQLRHAVSASDLVVVARHDGSTTVREHLRVHRLAVRATLKGEHRATLSVLEVEGVELHQRPRRGAARLYCLRRLPDAAAGELPAGLAPYFQMKGHPGSNPVVGDDVESDAACELARIVIASESGAAPRDVNRRLLALVLHGPPGVRTEAAGTLAERPVLLAALDPLQLNDLTTRAVGETEDIPFKIALASLCAEREVRGLVDALCLSLDAVEDPRFARALGRIARRLHGENALDVLRPHIVRPTRAATRDRLLLALGATATDRALQALLRMRSVQGASAAVDAALRAHGSRQAREAIGTK